MSLLIKILKNYKNILNGIFNSFFSSKSIKYLFKERYDICNKCDSNSKNFYLKYKSLRKQKKIYRFDNYCINCECNIKFKTHSKNEKCPELKW